MEQLLRWAADNSDTDALAKQADAIRRGEAKPDPSRYDPKILEAILGKDDATRMKEAVACISDPDDTVENKEIALDNLELLIEGIDNAGNIENMKLWPQIITQFEAKDAEVRKGIAWVCGTAVQNNPKAQEAFLKNGGLKPLVALLNDDNKDVRSKAQYAISGFLKHNPVGVKAFNELKGFEILHNILKSDQVDSALLRKVIFSYNSLMLDDLASPSEDNILATHLKKDGILNDLEKVLVKYTDDQEDEDMVEKTLRTIHTIVTNAKFSDPDHLKVTDSMKAACEKAKAKYGAENLQLTKSEWEDLL